MTVRKFLIASFALAGFSNEASGQDFGFQNLKYSSDTDDQNAAVKLFRLDHLYTLAGHASHSSHRSHSSHSSHSSGSGGGGYYTPAPTYSPPPPPPPPPPSKPKQQNKAPSGFLDFPTTPQPTPQATPEPAPLRGNTELFNTIVRRVQLGLKAYGYYSGEIDGVVGPTTRDAISKMQTDYSLKVTGTITPELLDALRIVAQ